MKHLRFLIIPAALLALLAAGCGGTARLGAGVIAKVGSVTITRAQLDSLMQRARQNYKAQKRPFPKETSPEFTALRDQGVQLLVQRAEFAQEADDMNVKVGQKQIDKRLKEIKKLYFGGSEKKYKRQLKKQGLTQEMVLGDIESQLLQTALFDKVTADVSVTPEQVRKYYDTHKSTYTVAESRVVRYILVKKKDKALADRLSSELRKNPSNFVKYAKKYSTDPTTASQGGKFTVTRGQTEAPFEQTAFLLGKGTVSAPVETSYGWHIIEPISGVHAAHTTPFKDVKESIKQQLLQEKKTQAITKWVNGLKKKFKPKYQVGYAPQPSQTTTTGTSG
jgi:foldase protein PrsA